MGWDERDCASDVRRMQLGNETPLQHHVLTYYARPNLGYYSGHLVRIDALCIVGIDRGHNVVIRLAGENGSVRESGACVERRIESGVRPARNRAAIDVVAYDDRSTGMPS